ncbi:TldD/PmbA family protein [Paraburkholderia phenoliruptrix]|uniref:TldD/PmbA family protein n=1 Tax=Paraburkholderia phenoliruptrix TaxID=252970 RepID=UPI0028699251|nr:metallopeptidase TldD-related protein [Paraburkholderia phenoliruptrix]WMY12678.1 metallopeptidase TldD-related protein [Paraburkholderia phenoliruptrix]
MQSSSTQLQTVADELASSAERVIEFARRAGADGTRVEIEAAESRAVAVTNRVPTERSFRGTLEMTVTVFRDGKRAFAKSSDLSDEGLSKIVRGAIDSTAATESDPAAGFADPGELARDFPDLDLHHPLDWSLDELGAHAQRAEDAALAHDTSIKASKGVTVRTVSGVSLLATSAGFLATAPWSIHSIACAPVAFGTGEKQIGFWGDATRAFDDLAKPEDAGALAARRALDALGATQVPTQQCPVLFEPSASLELLSELVSLASGDALYRSGSFLKDGIDSPLFPPHVQLDEDPFVKRGMASRCFDSDGIAGLRRKVVEDGCLRGFFLGLYAARRLNLTPTGNGYGAHNLKMSSTRTGPRDDFAAMLRKLHCGLLVTEMVGGGLNRLTGDFSRGAKGFWVENGEIRFPVRGITIASNLRQMFGGLQAIGNDAITRGGATSGSWLIDAMKIGGA